MKHLLLFLVCSLFFCTAVLAQEAGEKKSIKGTYQIEVHNTRGMPYIPDNFEQLILSNRKPDKVNYIIISEYVKVLVLPEAVINSPGFVPITREVIHYFN